MMVAMETQNNRIRIDVNDNRTPIKKVTGDLIYE